MDNDDSYDSQNRCQLGHIARCKITVKALDKRNDNVIREGGNDCKDSRKDYAQTNTRVVDKPVFLDGIEKQHRIDGGRKYIDRVFPESRVDIHKNTDEHNDHSDKRQDHIVFIFFRGTGF